MGRKSRPRNDFPSLWPNVRRSVRILRQAHRINQEELAERIGVLRTTVTNIESGHQKTTLEQLYAIARELGVDVWALLPTIEDAAREYRTKEQDLEELAACVLAAADGNQAAMAQAEAMAKRILPDLEMDGQAEATQP